ncbi:hypothetical protein ACTXT7_000398 [Hymenolepis weldensis]
MRLAQQQQKHSKTLTEMMLRMKRPAEDGFLQFKISGRNKNDSSFDEIDVLTAQVKKQLNHFNYVTKSWNKYEEKSADAAVASKSFEEAIMVSCGIKQVHNIIETTKQFSMVDSQESFDAMKKKLEQFLEKQLVDRYQVELLMITERLQQEIPRQLSDNEARMYDCMMRYYQKKRESLAAGVESTEVVFNQLKQMHHLDPALTLSGSTTTITNRNSVKSSYLLSLPNNNGEYSKSAWGTISTTVPSTLNSKMNENSNKPPHSVPDSIEPNSKNGTDLTTKPKPFEVVAVFAYKSEEEDEVEFEVGDYITVQEWPCPEDENKSPEPGWLYGKHKKTGKEGLFPANHVKLP